MSPRPHDGVNWPSWTSISTASQQMDQIASVQHTSDSHQTQPQAAVRQSLLLQEECYTLTLLHCLDFLRLIIKWKGETTWYGWTKIAICVWLLNRVHFYRFFHLVTNSAPPLACQILSSALNLHMPPKAKRQNICLRVTQQSQVLFPSCISL